MRVGCVVLAAGCAARFGSQKLLVEYAGIRLISRALMAIPENCPTAVITGELYIKALAEAYGMKVVTNDRPQEGISRTVRLGVEAMQDCDAICFLVADQPLLRRESVDRMIELWKRYPDQIIRAAHNGNPGNPCIFPRSFFPALRKLYGDRGGSTIIKENPQRVRFAELPAEELLDCDTPEAFAVLSGKEDAH